MKPYSPPVGRAGRNDLPCLYNSGSRSCVNWCCYLRRITHVCRGFCRTRHKCRPNFGPCQEVRARRALGQDAYRRGLCQSSEAGTCLEFAKSLAIFPAICVVLVCSVTPRPSGKLGLTRFLRFVKRADWARHWNRTRLRFVVWACCSNHDGANDLAGLRSIVLVRTRWRRPWGRSVANGAPLKGNSLTLVL